MLCPSEGMETALSQIFPASLLWPSYRSITVAVFFLVSFPICYLYIGFSQLIIYSIDICRTQKPYNKNVAGSNIVEPSKKLKGNFDEKKCC
jgi:hypothetical protein